MRIKFDDALLREVALGDLPEHEAPAFLEHMHDTLELRVGMALADQMSAEQLDEFEVFVDANDDEGAFAWLESNLPEYKDVVNRLFTALKEEVLVLAPQILRMSKTASSGSE